LSGHEFGGERSQNKSVFGGTGPLEIVTLWGHKRVENRTLKNVRRDRLSLLPVPGLLRGAGCMWDARADRTKGGRRISRTRLIHARETATKIAKNDV